MNSQRSTSTVYPCVITNLLIQTLQLAKINIIIFVQCNILKWFRVLKKELYFVNFWLKRSNFGSIVKKLVPSLGDSIMYPAALNKICTQTADSSQVFRRLILQKQPKIINKITKSWDRSTINDLEHVCSKQDHDFLS